MADDTDPAAAADAKKYSDLGGYKRNTGGDGGGGLSQGATFSKEQDDAIKQKAAGGIVIGNDALDYMGHFANDNVTRQGHNVGHKPLGTAHFKGGAKRGFHKLPGSASGLVGAATRFERDFAEDGIMPATGRDSERARNARPAGAAMPPMRIRKSDAPMPAHVEPVARAVRDVKMSVKHHRESIANDLKHAREHMESAKQHRREMKSQQKRLKGKR